MDVTQIAGYWPTLKEVVLMLVRTAYQEHTAASCTAYTAVVDSTNLLVHVCVTILQ